MEQGPEQKQDQSRIPGWVKKIPMARFFISTAIGLSAIYGVTYGITQLSRQTPDGSIPVGDEFGYQESPIVLDALPIPESVEEIFEIYLRLAAESAGPEYLDMYVAVPREDGQPFDEARLSEFITPEAFVRYLETGEADTIEKFEKFAEMLRNPEAKMQIEYVATLTELPLDSELYKVADKMYAKWFDDMHAPGEPIALARVPTYWYDPINGSGSAVRFVFVPISSDGEYRPLFLDGAPLDMGYIDTEAGRVYYDFDGKAVTVEEFMGILGMDSEAQGLYEQGIVLVDDPSRYY